MAFYSQPIKSLFFQLSLLSLLLLLMVSCQRSYRVLNHGEIRAAYLDGDYRYIPNLKWIVENQNRDLGANAMQYLGYFYRDLAIKGKDRLIQQEVEVFLDLENYFLSNTKVGFDFNLKNIIYHNLSYSSHPQVREIYEKVLSSPTLNDIDQDNPVKENAVAILRFVGKSTLWMKSTDESNFEASLSLCRKGLDSNDSDIFTAGLQCWVDVYSRFIDSAERDQIKEELSRYLEKFENEYHYRYHLIISQPIFANGIKNTKGV